jgi:hypothetical protein
LTSEVMEGVTRIAHLLDTEVRDDDDEMGDDAAG